MQGVLKVTPVRKGLKVTSNTNSKMPFTFTLPNDNNIRRMIFSSTNIEDQLIEVAPIKDIKGIKIDFDNHVASRLPDEIHLPDNQTNV